MSRGATQSQPLRSPAVANSFSPLQIDARDEHSSYSTRPHTAVVSYPTPPPKSAGSSGGCGEGKLCVLFSPDIKPRWMTGLKTPTNQPCQWCVRACVHACTYVPANVSVCVCLFLSGVCVCVCVCVCIYMCVCVCVCVCVVCMCVRACVCVCV